MFLFPSHIKIIKIIKFTGNFWSEKIWCVIIGIVTKKISDYGGIFMYRASLILEGGGMRGLFTAGVIDYFMDQEIEFKSIYAVV